MRGEARSEFISGTAAPTTASRFLACPKPAGDKESDGGHDKTEGGDGLKFRTHDINVAQAASLLLLKV
jgi:hypothetical protein